MDLMDTISLSSGSSRNNSDVEMEEKIVPFLEPIKEEVTTGMEVDKDVPESSSAAKVEVKPEDDSNSLGSDDDLPQYNLSFRRKSEEKAVPFLEPIKEEVVTGMEVEKEVPESSTAVKVEVKPEDDSDSLSSGDELPQYSLSFRRKSEPNQVSIYDPGPSTSQAFQTPPPPLLLRNILPPPMLSRNSLPPSRLKRITVAVIDAHLETDKKISAKIHLSVLTAEARAKTEILPCSRSIIWFYGFGTESSTIGELENRTYTKDVLCVFYWKEFLEGIANKTIGEQIKEIKQNYVERRISIVIYNLKSYYNYQLRKSRGGLRTTKRTSKRAKLSANQAEFDSIPVQSEEAVKEVEVELQLTFDVDILHVSNENELGDVVYHFTRSTVYAHEKINKIKQEDLTYSFRNHDHFNKIRLTGNRLGLNFTRFWEHQLSMFPKAQPAHAEAIVHKYPTYKSLMDAYEKSSDPENLLRDIPVRMGPMGTIGAELSNKIYKFYNSLDANILL